MSETREEKILQCLDELLQVNELVTCSLHKCEELVDLPSTFIGRDAVWRDVIHGIKSIITTSEKIVQKNRELLN